jgi:transposase-like protein
MKNDRNHLPNGTPEEIAAILTRYRASGLGLERFAREHGIPPGRLHYWLYQKQSGEGSRRRTQPTQPALTPVFQEIQLAARPESVGTWAAEVCLPRGVAVRFSPAATAQWIGSVVQALQRPC